MESPGLLPNLLQEIRRTQKSTSGGAFCAHLDHIRLCRFHALARNRQLHPIASLNLKLFRLMQVHAWRAFPALNLWDSIINILHSKLAATPSLFIKKKSKNIRNHMETLTVFIRTRDYSACELHFHLRRQRSCNETKKQRQKSNNASCITHTSC